MNDSTDPIFSRLQDIKSVLKVKVSDVSEFTGMSKQAIYDIFAGKVESINKKFIEYLTNKLNINVNWIFTGEGEMQRNTSVSSNNHNIISKSKDVKNVTQTQGGVNQTEKHSPVNNNEVEMLHQQIESLKRENELLHSQLERANKTIDMLEGLLQKK